MQKLSVEYAHIYTNSNIKDEHQLSLDTLQSLGSEYPDHYLSLVVMIDDYSFPDPSFDYDEFFLWLGKAGYKPDVAVRESQLIPQCDMVLKKIQDEKLKNDIVDYIVTKKKYPCSLFIATRYLIRLGLISAPFFDSRHVADSILNILPYSFQPFEEKGLEIIGATDYKDAVHAIAYKYFEGRLIA